MEAKDMEVLRQLEHYKKTTNQLYLLLKKSEFERDRYIQECNGVKDRINELESKMKGMTDQLSESAKIHEHLSSVLIELKITQADLLNLESQLAAAKDLELKAIIQAKMMEAPAKTEKEGSEELSGRVEELRDAARVSKLAATEDENEKCRIVSEKDAEMEAFKATLFQAQEEMEDLRKQLKTIQELENQLVMKSMYNDSLQAKLEQVTNVLGSTENASLDGGIDLKQIAQDLEFKARKISDQAFYIAELETELKRDEVRKREKDDQRDKCLEYITISMEEYNYLIRKAKKADEISRSTVEYFNQLTTESANKNEVEALKKELKVVATKIQNRAEQTATRAEAAEKAKAAEEDQLRKWQEQMQRRKPALAALREESAPKQFSPPTIENLPTNHQPLGQFLNLEILV
ncbi:Detected protein of unknown function [Hibiscus syriacus]|uniref:Uncharacterized protein n=1 Tax=Hibiscus syriacus TaxID=106335 RepID=A0A6A2YC07_HIBSY|nr:Detected protein of unknown function [Hibiscus syriacus]